MTAQLTTAMTVASVMTPNPVAVRPHTPVKDILALMAGHAIGAVPVISATGLVIGVVSETDLLRATGKRRTRGTHRWTAGEVMISPVTAVRSDATLTYATRVLAESGLRQVFVVDDGRLVGVLARRDVLGVFLRPDKEILADIEHQIVDRPELSVHVSVDGGVVLLTGRLPARGDLATERILDVPGVIDVRDRVSYDNGMRTR